LISVDHAGKVMGHIEQAVQFGARVLVGGRRRDDLGPAFVEPTVLMDVQADAEAASNETFGPVVALYPVQSVDDAVARANASEYGLNATVWSKDAARGREVARRIETGSVVVNSSLMIYNSFDVPMGGVKLSGLGRRHGEQGILRFTQAQSVVTSFRSGGGYDAILARMRDERWVKRLLKTLRWWRRMG
jgi:acyl-CoA reductase-like NAD-dependent aldehyde dehydrogenase